MKKFYSLLAVLGLITVVGLSACKKQEEAAPAEAPAAAPEAAQPSDTATPPPAEEAEAPQEGAVH